MHRWVWLLSLYWSKWQFEHSIVYPRCKINRHSLKPVLLRSHPTHWPLSRRSWSDVKSENTNIKGCRVYCHSVSSTKLSANSFKTNSVDIGKSQRQANVDQKIVSTAYSFEKEPDFSCVKLKMKVDHSYLSNPDFLFITDYLPILSFSNLNFIPHATRFCLTSKWFFIKIN